MMVIARTSNLIGKITVLVMVFLCVNTALALDGSGTEEDPWRIKSLEDFDEFAADANYWAGFTRLETDVNLAGMVYDRAVIAPYPASAFTGIFDGNDHKIMNLTIDDGGVGNDWLGLFGSVDNGEVRNLGLEGGSISGNKEVGGLVGINSGGSISNCYSTCSVSGAIYVGGLTGINGDGSILNCYFTGDVSGNYAGGLAGWNEDGSILKCYSTGDVNGVNIVGGLVGESVGGDISNCYSTGDVSGEDGVGGLVGENFFYGSISNCYSAGSVGGHSVVGGLVGINRDSISNCYSTGDVSGSIAGGLAGLNEYGSILNCFWDTDTQTHDVTDSIGYNDGGTITNVLGLPTSQLQQQSTFTNWDFINVWNIGENQTCPYLRVYLPSDINKDQIVNFLDLSITANQWMEEQ